MKDLFRVLGLCLCLLLSNQVRAQTNAWKPIDEGLSLGVFDAPCKSEFGDSKITVVRIDPHFYAFRLLSALQQTNSAKTAREWCRSHRLVAAINASMYLQDHLTPVGYTRTDGHVLQPRTNDYKCYIAFGRSNDSVPEVQIIDTQYQDLATVGRNYGTLIQNIRAVSLRGENVWKQQPAKWSMAVMGMDTNGCALWIFTRSPYTAHDFIGMLPKLPISLRNATYLDGGPPASLYLSAKGTEVDLCGSYETKVNEADSAVIPWRVPNVIGIVRRKNLEKWGAARHTSPKPLHRGGTCAGCGGRPASSAAP